MIVFAKKVVWWTNFADKHWNMNVYRKMRIQMIESFTFKVTTSPMALKSRAFAAIFVINKNMIFVDMLNNRITANGLGAVFPTADDDPSFRTFATIASKVHVECITVPAFPE
jgi:hypothetical protein